jgi:hypothetical protein
MLYIQGDIMFEPVGTGEEWAEDDPSFRDADGSLTVSRGSATGHRHRFTGQDGVKIYRATELARDVPDGLYIAHLEVLNEAAVLLHNEHGDIVLPKGAYRVRRQREWSAGDARIVAD